MYTHTHTAILWPFVWDYLGGAVPEYIILDFKRCGKDNRGKCADNPTGCHLIRTIDAPPPSSPQFYAGCPSCRNPPNLSWLGTGTKYAGLHTWTLGISTGSVKNLQWKFSKKPRVFLRGCCSFLSSTNRGSSCCMAYGDDRCAKLAFCCDSSWLIDVTRLSMSSLEIDSIYRRQ